MIFLLILYKAHFSYHVTFPIRAPLKCNLLADICVRRWSCGATEELKVSCAPWHLMLLQKDDWEACPWVRRTVSTQRPWWLESAFTLTEAKSSSHGDGKLPKGDPHICTDEIIRSQHECRLCSQMFRSDLTGTERHERYPLVFNKKSLNPEYTTKGEASKSFIATKNIWVYGVGFAGYQFHGEEGEKGKLRARLDEPVGKRVTSNHKIH